MHAIGKASGLWPLGLSVPYTQLLAMLTTGIGAVNLSALLSSIYTIALECVN